MRPVVLCSALAFVVATLVPSQAQVLRRSDDMAPIATPQKQQPAKRIEARCTQTRRFRPGRDGHARDAAGHRGLRASEGDRRRHRGLHADHRGRQAEGRRGAPPRSTIAATRMPPRATTRRRSPTTTRRSSSSRRARGLQQSRHVARRYGRDGSGDRGFQRRRSSRTRASPRPISTAPSLAAQGRDRTRARRTTPSAIRFNRRNVNAYIARGALLLAGGETAKARVDMKLAAALDRQQCLCGAVARDRRAPRQAEGRAGARRAGALDMKAWPAPVLRLFAGRAQGRRGAGGGGQSGRDGEGGAYLRGELLQRRACADRR